MEKFEWQPEIEIIHFGTEDIVTTSNWYLDDDELPGWVIG
jgi:hypothetical protein